MKLNEASWDRIARVAVGIALIGIGLLAVGGGWGWALGGVGIVLLVTGLIGWCPIYATLRMGTRKSDSTVPEISEGSAAA
jgi:hypothetical protein